MVEGHFCRQKCEIRAVRGEQLDWPNWSNIQEIYGNSNNCFLRLRWIEAQLKMYITPWGKWLQQQWTTLGSNHVRSAGIRSHSGNRLTKTGQLKMRSMSHDLMSLNYLRNTQTVKSDLASAARIQETTCLVLALLAAGGGVIAWVIHTIRVWGYLSILIIMCILLWSL